MAYTIKAHEISSKVEKNIQEKIRAITSNYSFYIEKAREFQNRYLYYLCDTEGRHEFCNHFTTLIEQCIRVY